MSTYQWFWDGFRMDMVHLRRWGQLVEGEGASQGQEEPPFFCSVVPSPHVSTIKCPPHIPVSISGSPPAVGHLPWSQYLRGHPLKYFNRIFKKNHKVQKKRIHNEQNIKTLNEVRVSIAAVSFCLGLQYGPCCHWCLIPCTFPVSHQSWGQEPDRVWASRQTQEPQTMFFSASCLLLGA